MASTIFSRLLSRQRTNVYLFGKYLITLEMPVTEATNSESVKIYIRSGPMIYYFLYEFHTICESISMDSLTVCTISVLDLPSFFLPVPCLSIVRSAYCSLPRLQVTFIGR